MQEGKTISDVARDGANAANANRTPVQRTKLSKKAAKALWKGHIKKQQATCPCIMCKKRRAEVYKEFSDDPQYKLI